jgi:hypothetical protein
VFAGIHVARAAVGVMFLVQLSRGRLPESFALRAGPGDIAIGLGAFFVIAALPASTSARRAFVAAWCLLGMVDLVVAIGTAQYLLLIVRDPLMANAAHLPFAVIPTIIVPIMMLTHVLILARLRSPAVNLQSQPNGARTAHGDRS